MKSCIFWAAQEGNASDAWMKSSDDTASNYGMGNLVEHEYTPEV